MAKKKKPRPRRNYEELSAHGSLQESIKAAISNPERTEPFVQDEIIKIMKSRMAYKYPANWLTITFEELCEILPDLTREEIVLALQGMRDIHIIDTPKGLLKFPEHYFIERQF